MTETNTKNGIPADTSTPSGGPESSPKVSRRKKVVRWGAVGLLILLLAVGIPAYLHSLSHVSTDDAFIDGDIVPISPRVSGHVSRILVKDNQWVKAGTLLVELDPRDFMARLAAAKADLSAARAAARASKVAVELTTITSTAGLAEAKDNREEAKAAVQEAVARLRLARAALAQARAETDSARVQHKLDATDLQRYREMAKTKTVSPRDLDHARAAERIAAAAWSAAKKKTDTQKAMVREAVAALQAAKARQRQADARLAAAHSAPQQISQSRSRAEVSHADIDKARAEVRQARLDLSYAKIYAPCDGFVTKKQGEAGQFVQAGESLLALVSREVWVTANFKETRLTRMRPGQPAVITVDAYPDLSFHGHVDSIQHGSGARFSLLPPENATGNYVKVVQRVPVKIVFDRPEETAKVLLAPGMSVVPEVNVGAKGWPKGGPAKKTAQNKAPKVEKKRAAGKR